MLARMLHYTRSEGLAREKHNSLMGPFVSYGGNEELLSSLWNHIQSNKEKVSTNLIKTQSAKSISSVNNSS
jgi:hypothetical protein